AGAAARFSTRAAHRFQHGGKQQGAAQCASRCSRAEGPHSQPGIVRSRRPGLDPAMSNAAEIFWGMFMDSSFRWNDEWGYSQRMVPFSFAGETFVASSEGALYWPAQNALLVADLHLEKASWFARLGQFLPPYDSVATLTALAEVAEQPGGARVFSLGDSFHDRFGCDRLSDQARSLLLDM